MKNIFIHSYLCILLIFCGIKTGAQVNITSGETFTENFNSIGTSATATLPAHWRVDKLNSARAAGSYSTAVDLTDRIGGDNLATTAAHGIYNFGAGPATTATERAIGFLATGGGTFSGNLYIHFRNTGCGIDSLNISYNVEKYRNGSNTAGYRIQLFYSSDGLSWTSAGTNFNTEFSADADNSGYASAPGNTSPVSAGLNAGIASGADFYLCWNYSVITGGTHTNAQALAIDDVSISFTNSSHSTKFFRSRQTGTWHTPSTWEVSPDGITCWEIANTFPTHLSQTINIRNSHTVSLDSDVTADQIIIDEGATLDYAAGTLTMKNGPGTDLIINGTYIDGSSSGIIWEDIGIRWSMGGNGNFIKLSNTSLVNYSSRYEGGISNIPSTSNWIIRKVPGKTPPATIPAVDMFYPNLTIENTTAIAWSISFPTGSGGFPTVKGFFNLGGSETGPITFTNNNSNPTPAQILGNFTIGSNCTLVNNGTGFNVERNLTVNGILDYGTLNDRKTIFSGSSEQTINGSGTIITYKFILNKEPGNLNILRNVQIDHHFDLQNGVAISSATSYPIVNTNATATVKADGTSYVDGPVRKIGSADFVFPIGKNGMYRPAAISNLSEAATFTAEYFEADPHPLYNTTNKEASIDHLSRCEYWIIDRNSASGSARVTLSWNTTSCGVDQLADLIVSRWDGSEWKNHGNGGTTGNNTTGTVISSGNISTFSPFTLASISPANPLPVSLLNFNGECAAGKFILNWSTASEINNKAFELEYSINGSEFFLAGTIAGAGNSHNTRIYNFTDEQNRDAKTVYYRLKQIDYDHTFSFSKIIAVNNCGVNSFEIARINQSRTHLEIFINNPSGEIIEYSIINLSGAKVYSKKTEPESIVSEKINIADFPNGIYLLSINNGRESLRKKLIIVN
jgi:hypothetical protein